MANGERLREIVSVLGSYGFGHIYNTKIRTRKKEQDPEKLRKAFEELGPSFIKIGQIISTRRDILPEEYIRELSKLQDAAPPFPFESVKKIFREDFSQNLEDVFEFVEEVPSASASVAQVHRAKLKTGEEVVLKVRRPDIEDNFLKDIDLFIKIVSKAPNMFRDVVVDPKMAFEEIRETTKVELDFRNEAVAMVKFREYNSDIACVNAPKPYLNYSSQQIIVQERVDGIKVMETGQLLTEGYYLEDIGKKLLLGYLSQVFRDGYFHGDPHPGNIIIKGGQIYFIDFGIVGHLSNYNKDALNNILKAIVLKDIDQLMGLLLQLGIQKGKIDRLRFHDDLAYIFDTYLTANLGNFKIAELLADVFDITRKHSLMMPSEFTTLVKSMTILEGVIRDLSPNVNVVETAQGYFRQGNRLNLLEPISTDELLLGTYQLVRDSVRIPSQVSKLLENLINGRAKFNINLMNMEDKWIGFNKMVNRIVFALIVSALIIASAFIINSSDGGGLSLFGIVCFSAGGLLGLWLLISIIRSGRV